MTALASALLAAAALAAAGDLPAAAPRQVTVRAEKTTVRLGEPFRYAIEVRHAADERYALPGPPAIEPFRAGGVRCERKDGREEARTTCTMTLALFALGPVDVPEIVLDVDRPAGKARLAVPGARVTGAGMIDPAADAAALALRDVAPPVPLLVPTLRPLWWALGALGVGLLAWTGIRAARRLARRTAPPAPGPAERFALALAALEAEDLPGRGQGPEHVARLAEAVRVYVAALTGLPALDLTTGELVAALVRAPDLRIDAAALEWFLSGADLVKFARAPAPPEACAAGLAFARALLERTIPVATVVDAR